MQYFLLGYEILVIQTNVMVPNHSMFVYGSIFQCPFCTLTIGDILLLDTVYNIVYCAATKMIVVLVSSHIVHEYKNTKSNQYSCKINSNWELTISYVQTYLSF